MADTSTSRPAPSGRSASSSTFARCRPHGTTCSLGKPSSSATAVMLRSFMGSNHLPALPPEVNEPLAHLPRRAAPPSPAPSPTFPGGSRHLPRRPRPPSPDPSPTFPGGRDPLHLRPETLHLGSELHPFRRFTLPQGHDCILCHTRLYSPADTVSFGTALPRFEARKPPSGGPSLCGAGIRAPALLERVKARAGRERSLDRSWATPHQRFPSHAAAARLPS